MVLVEKHPDVLDHLAWEFLYSEQMKPSNRKLASYQEEFSQHGRKLERFRKLQSQERTDLGHDCGRDDRAVQTAQERVVNHGDTWTNNLLFKYDDSGRPVHVTLIDFQVCRYTSPAMDIQYFLFTSVRDDVIDSRVSDLLDAYLGALNKQLEELGSTQRLSRRELERELHVSLSVCIHHSL